jgi:proteasome accessory factor C
MDLKVKYHSTIRDTVTERVITPLELSLDLGFEVLNAYCQNAEGFRTFRLDNMRSVQMAGSSVSVPEPSDVPIISGSCSSNHASVHHPRDLGLLINHENLAAGEEITVNSFSQDWLLRNAMSTLASVEVRLPVSARSLISEKCQQTLELYENWVFPN